MQTITETTGQLTHRYESLLARRGLLLGWLSARQAERETPRWRSTLALVEKMGQQLDVLYGVMLETGEVDPYTDTPNVPNVLTGLLSFDEAVYVAYCAAERHGLVVTVGDVHAVAVDLMRSHEETDTPARTIDKADMLMLGIAAWDIAA